MRRITIITTGGTIEKTYDEHSGELVNLSSQVRRMLAELRLENTEISVIELMSKDSLDMTDTDRQRILEAARLAGAEDRSTGSDGVVILVGFERGTCASSPGLTGEEEAELEGRKEGEHL